MKKISNLIISFVFIIISISCSTNDAEIDELDLEGGLVSEIEVPDWTDLTHGKNGETYYDLVFPNTNVNRIDINIDADSWAAMQSNLSANISSQRGGAPGELDFDPIWVPCDLFFEDTQWYKVGIRYKGNSSLQSTYQQGLDKLPFKLDFDEFEDTYPAIENQRFFVKLFRTARIVSMIKRCSSLHRKSTLNPFYCIF